MTFAHITTVGTYDADDVASTTAYSRSENDGPPKPCNVACKFITWLKKPWPSNDGDLNSAIGAQKVQRSTGPPKNWTNDGRGHVNAKQGIESAHDLTPWGPPQKCRQNCHTESEAALNRFRPKLKTCWQTEGDGPSYDSKGYPVTHPCVRKMWAWSDEQQHRDFLCLHDCDPKFSNKARQ
jgi:hypothetical protein